MPRTMLVLLLNIRPMSQIWPLEALYTAYMIIGHSHFYPFRSAISAQDLGGRDGRQPQKERNVTGEGVDQVSDVTSLSGIRCH